MNKEDKAEFTEMTLEKANFRIEKLPPGRYEARSIFGELWSDHFSPVTLGKAFKRAVVEGKFKNIELIATKTNNHQFYEIFD